MAKYFRTIMIQLEYPDDMLDTEDGNPTGSGITSPLTEITKIIRDGCGESYTSEKHAGGLPGYSGTFIIEGV
jgi:hypothetical protein